jgi:phosphatidylserine/phosphatidylglycerophosphate/cardiolipin synthase-like enzyme
MSIPLRSLRKISESVVADALPSDLLGAAEIMRQLAQLFPEHCSIGVIGDIARDANVQTDRVDGLLETLEQIGVLIRRPDTISLSVSSEDARDLAAFVRGYAYAKHQQRDLNQIEITLTPPSRPSRLMSILPKQGFAWAGLHETADNLIHLASCAKSRLVVMSPFVDEVGLDWIEQIFATTNQHVKRAFIVRAADDRVKQIIRQRRSLWSIYNAEVFSYAIPRDLPNTPWAIETFHAKIVLSDRDRAYIGSTNMNSASREISMECGVTIHGPAVKPVAALVDTIMSISPLL